MKLEKILNKSGYYKRKKPERKYKKFSIRPQVPLKKTASVLLSLQSEAMSGPEIKKKMTDQIIGMFFTIVLLIEHKMVNLLAIIDDSIENRMLGEKIDVFKDFLKQYDPEDDAYIEEYRLLLQPLTEVKSIRNSMAHDITQPQFDYGSLKQVDSYVKKRRPDMHANFKDCEDEKAKCIGLLATFGFIFSFQIAKLQVCIEH